MSEEFMSVYMSSKFRLFFTITDSIESSAKAWAIRQTFEKEPDRAQGDKRQHASVWLANNSKYYQYTVISAVCCPELSLLSFATL